jgi:hypothetical protein
MSFVASAHALVQGSQKGMTPQEILLAAEQPTITYANGRFPGQMRHVRGDIVAVVDPARKVVVTVYRNVIETDAREDQKDRDALRFKARRGQAARAARKGGK